MTVKRNSKAERERRSVGEIGREMQSVKSNPKSLRKPLRNVTNNNGVGRSFKLENTAAKKFNDKEKEHNPRAQSQAREVEGESDNDSLDSLLLVQSNLSALVHQVAILNQNWNRHLLCKQSILIHLNYFRSWYS